MGKTAIPCGEYDVEYRRSTKFKKLMPFLKDVPNFEGVMIHTGNRPCDSKGCILVGNKPRNNVGIILPRLIHSCNCFKVLEVDSKTLLYQVPGGMLSNLVSQLKEAGQLDKLPDVLNFCKGRDIVSGLPVYL